jgi:hypothetical protein
VQPFLQHNSHLLHSIPLLTFQTDQTCEFTLDISSSRQQSIDGLLDICHAHWWQLRWYTTSRSHRIVNGNKTHIKGVVVKWGDDSQVHRLKERHEVGSQKHGSHIFIKMGDTWQMACVMIKQRQCSVLDVLPYTVVLNFLAKVLLEPVINIFMSSTHNDWTSGVQVDRSCWYTSRPMGSQSCRSVVYTWKHHLCCHRTTGSGNSHTFWTQRPSPPSMK